jgi:hypothetical protein
MPLARRQDEGQKLARPLGTEVDFRGETSLAVPECFGLRSPPLAPAATK